MTTRGKGTKRPPKKKVNKADKPPDKDPADRARFALRPSVQAAVTVAEYGKSLGNFDLAGLITALTEQTSSVNNADLSRGEGMLTAQAHTLDAIFNRLALLAIDSKYMDHLDRYLKLALRAQSQCRATWEAVAAIKNPPMVGYVKQANIAHGHQQVNNAPSPESADPRTRENSKVQNKLLEQKDGERLDTGATGTAGTTDPAMAPVGKVDGTEDIGR